MTTTHLRADTVKIGHMVDLEGDRYADPFRDHPGFECEFAVVTGIDIETSECVCIYFDGFICEFPRGHLLRVETD